MNVPSAPSGSPQKYRRPEFWIGGGVGVLALVSGFVGVGLPNHPYQVVFGILTVGVGYHRRWWLLPSGRGRWIFPPLNVAALSFQFKLLIGGGVQRPLSWLQLPQLSAPPSGRAWFEVLPHWTWVWQPTPLAGWEIDVTRIQTFLFIVTLAGALFRFQPFASLTALVLITISVPAWAGFAWDGVMVSLLASVFCLYCQAPMPRETTRLRPAD